MNKRRILFLKNFFTGHFLIVILFSMITIIYIASCSGSNSDSSSGSDTFAVRMPASATKIDSKGVISINRLFNLFIKNVYAAETINFPSFSFSTEDSFYPSTCSALDYYRDSVDNLKLTPVSDLDENSTKTLKLVQNKSYYFFISAYINTIDGALFCNGSSGAISCSKKDICSYGGRIVTGNWTFSVNCPNDSQIEILKQTTSGNVYVKAVSSGTGTCSITATGKALDPSKTDGTTISISITKNFTVVAEDSTIPSVTKIEFSGNELPLNEKVDIDFNGLTYYTTGETPAGYSTNAPSDCNGDCAPFKVVGENIANCQWTTPYGTLGGTGVEYYWKKSTGSNVFGVLISSINSDYVLVQDKVLLSFK